MLCSQISQAYTSGNFDWQTYNGTFESDGIYILWSPLMPDYKYTYPNVNMFTMWQTREGSDLWQSLEEYSGRS